MNALLHVIKNHRPEVEKKLPEAEVGATEAMKNEPESMKPAVTDENCPVIRANQVFLSASNSGRLRVVFF